MIDKNEAPEGFEAVESFQGCLTCYFRCDRKCQRSVADCLSSNRKDGHDVIFMKKNEIPTT